MANILFICPGKTDPTAFYRASGVSDDLMKKTNHQIHVVQLDEAIVPWHSLDYTDIVMMQRPFSERDLKFCLKVKEEKKSIWVDYDDNLFAVNPENRTYQTYNAPDIQENVKNILKAADVVSVPTEYLKQCYSAYSKNIEVIPNAFNDGIFKRGELKKREKTVIWRGPDAHIYDLMTYGKEINRACESFPDWEFNFMGYYPWFLSETKNKGFLPGLDIIMYFHKLADMAPSVGHVLLHDDVFNRCRSNIAFIEFSYAGAVSVVPDWWSVPGALSYTDPASYYEAMRTVLAGEVDCEQMNREAWTYIQDCLRLSQVNVLRLNLINGLI